MALDTLKNPSLFQKQAFIGGQWLDTGKDFAVYNPANGDKVADVVDCGRDETDQAIQAAKQAFYEGWGQSLAEERHALLMKWAQLMDDHREDLATILTTEQGKPISEARSEIGACVKTTSWMAEEARRIDGEIPPTFKTDERYLVLRQPVGVCAAITPWNFPASMITRKIAPALAAGCTIILKPSEETPLVALALVKLAEQAGFPKGVINIITTNDSSSVGKALCESPDVRKISFTGSTEVGRILYRQSGDTIKKISLELGGNAPFIIFDDADLERAVQQTIGAKFRNAGQTCICANRIFVHENIMDDYTKKLKEAVEDLTLGNGLDEKTTLGPLINEQGHKKVSGLTKDALDNGAELVTGGENSDQGKLFFQPTILKNLNTDMKIFREEIFGPVAALYPFKDEADVIKQANDTHYGLAGYAYTKDLGRAIRVGERLEYGMVGINVPVVSNSAIPFGGVKQSGLGREGSHWGVEEYVELKYVCLGGIDD